MNFCIINGKSSRLIKGLIIQELPPVRKPEMRIETVEIDGRDGDIVNKLGYASYEKTMKIGLYGDFDIDEVISFFDTEGEVVFSNEIEKYYRFAIYKEIDFDRLIRFRTAEVVFHVQPFKFSTTESNSNLKTQLVNMKGGDYSKNGAAVYVNDEAYYKLTIGRKVTDLTDVFIAIEPMECPEGEYTLTIDCPSTGGGYEYVILRLVDDDKTMDDVFGDLAIKLQSGTHEYSVKLNGTHRYKYVWLSILPSPSNINVRARVTAQAKQNFVINSGNTFSKPRYTINGSGQCSIKVNDGDPFYLDLSGGEIVLDCEEMNAYKNDVLMNRYVLGNYEDLYITQGRNVISWDGLVSSLEIENYSRWI